MAWYTVFEMRGEMSVPDDSSVELVLSADIPKKVYSLWMYDEKSDESVRIYLMPDDLRRLAESILKEIK